MTQQKMKLCLWFNNQAEEAANFYTSIFEDSEIGRISRFGKEGFEFHRQPEGTAMTVEFRLNQMNLIALNGGNQQFTESTSIVLMCDIQEEIDHYWEKLTEGGEEGPRGWLKDKFMVSWQVIPSILPDYFSDEDSDRRSRVEQAAFQMKKFEIDKLKQVYENH